MGNNINIVDYNNSLRANERSEHTVVLSYIWDSLINKYKVNNKELSMKKYGCGMGGGGGEIELQVSEDSKHL